MLLLTMTIWVLACLTQLTKLVLVFFFNDTATTEIYTLSLHDALPISLLDASDECVDVERVGAEGPGGDTYDIEDRKSTRLNSSHGYISYAVFCLKKKQNERNLTHRPPTTNASGFGVCRPSDYTALILS